MRGHVRKCRTWEFIVDIGPHPVTGRSRQKSKGGFATRREAESALHEFIRYIEGGGDPSPERMGLGDYLHRWLEYQRARGSARAPWTGTRATSAGRSRRSSAAWSSPRSGPATSGRSSPGASSTDSRPPPSPRSEACWARRSARASPRDSSPRMPWPRSSVPGCSDGSSADQHPSSSERLWRPPGARCGRCRSCWPRSPGPDGRRSSASLGRTSTSRPARSPSAGGYSRFAIATGEPWSSPL